MVIRNCQHRAAKWCVPRIANALAALLLTFVAASAASGPALASSGWSIQPTANPFVGGVVSGVSCTSTRACTAVGGYVDSYNRQEMLAEQWNGTAWAIPPTPNPSGVVDSTLTGVSCTAATDCTAVGYGLGASDTDVTLAGQWNGTAWAIQTIPAPAYSLLSGVSCTAPNVCTAVGSSDITSTSGLTLAEAWNGSSWTIQTTPNPAGVTTSVLSGVSCTAASACTAVGYYINGSGVRETLAERWNGTAWAIQSTPSPSGATSSVLTGVSCTAASVCTAVGYYVNSSGGQETLAEQWNGSSWTIQTTPSPSGATSGTLSGVSCTAANACTAVGDYINALGTDVTLAERWDGNTWALQNIPNPQGGTSSTLSGAWCAAAAACTAVGNSSGATLVEGWNGTVWSIQPTPNPPGTGVLSGVSCTVATPCAAVGYSNPVAALAEEWNGANWAIQPSLSTQSTALHPVLSGVSCTAAAACTAAGAVDHSYCNPRPPYCKIVNGTAAVQWNGTTWSRMSTPNPSQATPSRLSGVSCTAATVCTAVGNSGGATLAEGWNGTAWAIQPTPGAGVLSGVSCTADNACTAAGNSGGQTLAERWNGTVWSNQSTPNPSGATSSTLSGVSCTPANTCTAVGYYVNSSGVRETLAEQWNGTAWAIQSIPGPSGATSSVLTGVSCTAATGCIAVGYYVNSSGVQETLAEQWNGSSWTIQATPNPIGATSRTLSGVSCTAANVCTAVGDYINALGTDVTLAERYSG